MSGIGPWTCFVICHTSVAGMGIPFTLEKAMSDGVLAPEMNTGGAMRISESVACGVV